MTGGQTAAIVRTPIVRTPVPGSSSASVARGRGAGTPFALLGSVAFLVWGAVAGLAVLLLLIWWVT